MWPGVSITRARAVAERHRVALGHRLVQLRQAVRVGGGADHLAPKRGAHRVDAGDVVVVVVGEQDQVEPAAGRSIAARSAPASAGSTMATAPVASSRSSQA